MNSMWLKADGSIEEVAPDNGHDFQLDELQRMVGGYIEHVRLEGGLEMWLNEEGKLKGLPCNRRATLIFQASHGRIDVIVGDVLVCQQGMVE